MSFSITRAVAFGFLFLSISGCMKEKFLDAIDSQAAIIVEANVDNTLLLTEFIQFSYADNQVVYPNVPMVFEIRNDDQIFLIDDQTIDLRTKEVKVSRGTYPFNYTEFENILIGKKEFVKSRSLTSVQSLRDFITKADTITERDLEISLIYENQRIVGSIKLAVKEENYEYEGQIFAEAYVIKVDFQ